MAELSRFFIGEYVELLRSEINFAEYNPRKIDDASASTLKRGIKQHGFLGGLVANKSEQGYTLISGHQRITQLDALEKYDPLTHENDYKLRVEVVEVDLKTEQELNILLNNPNAQGVWDYEKLRKLVPNIDYKMAGLTDADLSMIGVDYNFMTDMQTATTDDLTRLMMPATERHQQELAIAKEAKAALKETPEWQDKVQHMKEVKEQVKQNAMEEAGKMDAYIVLSFDNLENRQEFFDLLGLPADSKFIKGETVLNLLDPDSDDVF